MKTYLRPSIAIGLPLITLAATVVLSGQNASSANNQHTVVPITVTSSLPSDVPGGAERADLITASRFAWEEFIALNWPALSNKRDTANKAGHFGDTSSGPLVWQTYRAKSEIFPGIPSPPPTPGATPPVYPHGYFKGASKDYGYDDAPKYTYSVSPIAGSRTASPTPWVNLDEVSEIGLDNIYAGVGLSTPPTAMNAKPNLIRFMAKANRQEYLYVCQKKYWYGLDQNFQPEAGTPFGNAAIATKTAITNAIEHHVPPHGTFVDLPAGTVEVKSAWRLLGSNDIKSRFYTATARSYEPGVSGPVYYDGTWALIALHIIQKTPSGKAFVYATFEQADNILTEGAAPGSVVPVEDENGNVVHPPHEPGSTTPQLKYSDSPSHPAVTVVPGQTLSRADAVHVYYENVSKNTGLPSPSGSSSPDKYIRINRRDHDIPTAVISVNDQAHAAIRAYSQQHGIRNSPWQYYKLVSVQSFPVTNPHAVPSPQPTNPTPDPNGKYSLSSYFQANSVVESNYVLQNFSGNLNSDGANTNYPKPPPTPAASPLTPYPNVYLFPTTIGSHGSSFGMGGCMGCHGNAQRGGSDFSFILGASVSRPETSGDAATAKLLARKAARLTKSKF